MPQDPQMNPEEKAAEALILYSLSHAAAEHYTDEELLASLDATLTEEEKAVLHKIGSAPFSEIKVADTHIAEPALEFAGMYRLGSDQELDVKVREEMEAKRKELLEKIKAKKRKDV